MGLWLDSSHIKGDRKAKQIKQSESHSAAIFFCTTIYVDAMAIVLFIILGLQAAVCHGFIPSPHSFRLTRMTYSESKSWSSGNDSENGPVEYDDFDDFIGDSFDSEKRYTPSPSISEERKENDGVPVWESNRSTDVVVPLPQLVPDRSACRTRRFSLGAEVVLDRYLGTLGFQEVTDWQYYMTDQDEDGQTVGDRQKVSPNPFDPKQPRRTRQSSGSVLRLFRAEFVGALGGLLRSQGLENRVLIKEFSGELGLKLADRETRTLAKFQSRLVGKDDDNQDWRNEAMNRFNNPRTDNIRVQKLIQQTGDCPYPVLLGEVDLAEVEDEGWDSNEFYRATGVQPPKPGAIWLIYEYTGVGSTAARLTQASSAARWENLPKGKGFFGNPIDPPPLPPWSERAGFVFRGIVRQALEAVAFTHEQGVVHRSLGVPSLLVLPRKLTDKAAALSPLWSNVRETVVKFSDWGFSSLTDPEVLLQDEDFCRRARSFDVNLSKSSPSLLTVNFALAEDFHAL